ncbi:MAG: DUF5320 domain-containing protein [Candidatus Bathyarchaeia archaeon]
MVWSPFIGTGWTPPWFWWPWPSKGRGLCRWLWLNWHAPSWIYPAYPVVETRFLEWQKEVLERELKAIEERLKELRKS